MQVDELLQVIPDLDQSKMPGVDLEVADKLFDELLKGGEASITALVDRLTPADDGSDYRARFCLHNLAKTVATAEREAERQVFVRALLGGLAGKRPAAISVFLVQQLQWIAGDEEVGELAPLLKHDDPRLFDAALATLVVIGAAAEKPLRAAMATTSASRRAAIESALPEETAR